MICGVREQTDPRGVGCLQRLEVISTEAKAKGKPEMKAIVLYIHLKKFQVTSTGFEPMTSVVPVQWCYQLSHEVTQLKAGQFVGLVFP